MLEVKYITAIVNVNSMMKMKSWLQKFMEWKKMENMERIMDENRWKIGLQLREWVIYKMESPDVLLNIPLKAESLTGTHQLVKNKVEEL